MELARDQDSVVKTGQSQDEQPRSRTVWLRVLVGLLMFATLLMFDRNVPGQSHAFLRHRHSLAYPEHQSQLPMPSDHLDRG